MSNPRKKIKRETVFIAIGVVLSLGVLSGTIFILGSVAKDITDALNPNLGGATQSVKFDIQGFKALGVDQSQSQ